MAGTTEGGKRAYKTNIEKHGEDFYKIIGRKGGQNGHTGGFHSNPKLAKTAGKKGGVNSRRGNVFAYRITNMETGEKKQGKITEIATFLGYSDGTVWRKWRRNQPIIGWKIERFRLKED